MTNCISTSPAAGYSMLAFGLYRLDPVRHVLSHAGKPVRLGSRALEILLALVERAGQTVGTNELLARVWGNSVVEPGTLRVHIAALRKILGSGKSGVWYVENVSGRGYRFAAPVAYLQAMPDSAAADASASRAPAPVSGETGLSGYRTDNLPAPLTRMVGREQVLSTLAARVRQRRFVTLTGPGGIGKSTLALSVAKQLSASYPQGVCFVDLALLTEPGLVSGAFAAALGVAALAADPIPDILSFLRNKSMLVVLDTCEHVIKVAASLVEKVLQAAPEIHFLATSREPLRAAGESVHRLEPLAMPGQAALTAVERLAVPALQLFVERAEASSHTFELADADTPLIVEICRRLEGNPLAIELAAAHVDLLGVRGLAARLEEGGHLALRGRRTASPRHHTLRASLDWSYGLLSVSEQTILRRLAVFVGSFDLQSACAVATDEAMEAAEVNESLNTLVAKSLLLVDVTGTKVLYRLLDTPRAYALEKLRDTEEFAKIQRRRTELELWRASGPAQIPAPRLIEGDRRSQGGDALVLLAVQ